MLDLVIKGGRICDGSGEASRAADIGIRGERIACIGDLSGAEAAEVIDAAGRYVLPGFIDVHSHIDMQPFNAPERKAPLLQGVTTEIGGACGIGVFPLREKQEYLPLMRAILGDTVRAFPSCGAYREALPPTGTNIAVQAAHSPPRTTAVGMGDRVPDAAQRDRLLGLAREAFEEGACSLSTGLAYFPAAYGDTDEVADLAKVAAAFGAPVSVHQRTTFRSPQPDFDSREDVLEFARRSGAAVSYSHYRTKPSTAGQTEPLLSYIRRGLAEGLSVTADLYPYPVGASLAAVILPMWAMDGGYSRILERLRDPACRDRLLRDVIAENPRLSDGVVIHAPRHPSYLGRCYDDLAAERGQTVAEMLLDLLVEEELDLAYRTDTDFASEAEKQQEKDCVTLLSEPFFMVGSDTLPEHAFPHPRCWGAFARMLRLCVKYGMGMETFANRAAGLPAEVYGIRHRGFLREGYYADLCLFDPNRVTEHSDFSHPFLQAEGMDLVLVNGCATVRDGALTGARSGRALRRGQD